MSITDELLAAADNLADRAMRCGATPDYEDVRWKVRQLAANIDNEHGLALDAAHAEGFDKGFNSADDWVQNEAALAEHGYIALPKDANGVPINVGAEVEYVEEPSVRRVVSSLNLAGDGWWVYVGGIGRRPDKYRNFQPDSWERIIEDAQADGIRYRKEGMPSDFEALVERCKRLAGEDA